jgi:hypothetical protein
MLEEAAEEVVDRKTESQLEEGREHLNLFSIGCWNVLPFCRPPLKHRVIQEEIVLD